MVGIAIMLFNGKVALIMVRNWKNEPVLKFGFMTMRATISEVDEKNSKKGEPIYSESLFFEYGGNPFQYWPYALKWYKKAALQQEPLAEQILQQIEEDLLITAMPWYRRNWA